MKKHLDVEYTKPLDLLILLVSSILILLVTIYIFKILIKQPIISILVGLLLTVIYFYRVRKIIVKKSDFIIFKDKFEYQNKKTIYFENIKSFKINYISGASLRINFNNRQRLNISSNNNFCDSQNFEFFCKNLEQHLLEYKKTNIIKRSSFLETKVGYYFIVIITVITVSAILFSFFTEKKMNLVTFGMIISSFGTIWIAFLKNKKK